MNLKEFVYRKEKLIEKQTSILFRLLDLYNFKGSAKEVEQLRKEFNETVEELDRFGGNNA